MKTITIEIDNDIYAAFHALCPVAKLQLQGEINQMIKETLRDARHLRLRQLINEINSTQDYSKLNSEIIVGLLPID